MKLSQARIHRKPIRPCHVALVLALVAAPGCSVKKYAVGKLGDALAGGGTTFASDDDPELVKAAVPFSLKLMESLLVESPRHRGLLLAACSGFVQYSYAFIHEEADEGQEVDLASSDQLRARARRLYLRARGYGLRGLELNHPQFETELRKDPKNAVRSATRAEVPFLYWTAAAWGSAVGLAKDDPVLLGEQVIVEALIDRALELDEAFDHGAIHGFLITYEMARQGMQGDAAERARKHFDRATALTKGQLAAPLVSFAEAVCIQKQDRQQFQSLLDRALAINVEATPAWRLQNLVAQRRARWLLTRAEDLFLGGAGPEAK
jgi:predicted anti-sigma-YlaC factor YlaD